MKEINIKEWNLKNGFKLIHQDILKVIMYDNHSLKTQNFKQKMITLGFSDELMLTIFWYQNPKEKSSWFDHQIRNTRKTFEQQGILIQKNGYFYSTNKLLNSNIRENKVMVQEYIKKLTFYIHESSESKTTEKNGHRDNVSNNYKVIDQDKAKEIGRKGEEIFFGHLKNKIHSYKSIKSFLGGMDPNDFYWINENEETAKPYDFIINKIKFDVKTTIGKNNNFYISDGELSLIKNNELNIVQIWLDQNLYYKNHKILSSFDVLNNFQIKPTNYKAKLKIINSKSQND